MNDSLEFNWAVWEVLVWEIFGPNESVWKVAVSGGLFTSE